MTRGVLVVAAAIALVSWLVGRSPRACCRLGLHRWRIGNVGEFPPMVEGCACGARRKAVGLFEAARRYQRADEQFALGLAVVVAVLAFGLAGWLRVARYKECRNLHPAWYCLSAN